MYFELHDWLFGRRDVFDSLSGAALPEISSIEWFTNAWRVRAEIEGAQSCSLFFFPTLVLIISIRLERSAANINPSAGQLFHTFSITFTFNVLGTTRVPF